VGGRVVALLLASAAVARRTPAVALLPGLGLVLLLALPVIAAFLVLAALPA